MKISPLVVHSIDTNSVDIDACWLWSSSEIWTQEYSSTLTQPVSIEAVGLNDLRFKTDTTTIVIRKASEPDSEVVWSGETELFPEPDNGSGVAGDEVQHYTGIIDAHPPAITESGDGSIYIASCNVALNTQPDHTGETKTFLVNGTALVPTDGITQYIAVKYNNGTPIYYLENDSTRLNASDVAAVSAIWRVGTEIHSVSFDSRGIGLPNKTALMLTSTRPYSIAYGQSLTVSETSTPTPRTVVVTSALVFAGVDAQQVAAFNSSLTNHRLTKVYRTAGIWFYDSSSHVYDNTNYDNGTSMVVMTNTAKYSTRWLYRTIGDDTQVFYVLGGEYNNVANAQSEPAPTGIPGVVQNHAVLIGRIIVQYNASSGVVENVATTTFTSASINTHNNLNGLQGSGPDYYHLNATEYAWLSGGPYLRLDGVGAMTGDMTSRSILPETNNTYSLGSSTFKFSELHANVLQSIGIKTDIYGVVTSGQIVPTSSFGADIGATALRWNRVWAKDITINGFSTTANSIDIGNGYRINMAGYLSSQTQMNWPLNYSTSVVAGDMMWDGTRLRVGDGTNQKVFAYTTDSVTGQLLTGYVVGANTPIAATDSILQAFQKTQGQINARASTSDLALYLPLTAGATKPLTGTLYGTDIDITGYLLVSQGSGATLAQTFSRGGNLQLTGDGGRSGMIIAGSVASDTAGNAPYMYFAGQSTGVGPVGGGMMLQFTSSNGLDIYSWNNTAWIKKSQINSSGMIAVVGGTSSGFLKANGSIDTTSYLTASNPTFTGTLTGPRALLNGAQQQLFLGTTSNAGLMAWNRGSDGNTGAQIGYVVSATESDQFRYQTTGGSGYHSWWVNRNAGGAVETARINNAGLFLAYFGADVSNGLTVSSGTLTAPSANITGFGVLREYTASATTAALYSTGVTPSSTNYVLAFSDSGVDTYLNASTNVYLSIGDSTRLKVTTTGVNLLNSAVLQINGTTAIDASRAANFTSLSVGGTATAAVFSATANGTGENFKVGDDLWIGDVNLSNTAQLKGFGDATKAYLKFGTTGPVVGYDGAIFQIPAMVNISSFGVFRRYAPTASGCALYPLGVTPAGNNYVLFFTDTGTSTQVNGITEVSLNTTDIQRIKVTSAGLDLVNSSTLYFNGVACINSSREATFKFMRTINTYGDCGVSTGNGDSATYSTYNISVDSWYGIGFKCTYDSTVRIVMNTRTGDLSATGTVSAPNVIANAYTSNGDFTFSNSGTSMRGIKGTVGDNDFWRIVGGASAANAGFLEIATADDGTEPIYVRQYTGTFGSIARQVTLLDEYGNSTFQGNINCGSVVASGDWIQAVGANTKGRFKSQFSGNKASYLGNWPAANWWGMGSDGTTSGTKGVVKFGQCDGDGVYVADGVKFAVLGDIQATQTITSSNAVLGSVSSSGQPLVVNGGTFSGLTTSGVYLSCDSGTNPRIELCDGTYNWTIDSWSGGLRAFVGGSVKMQLTSTSGMQIKGAVDGTAVISGNVGQVIESRFNLVSMPAINTIASLASITLTPGRWEVSGHLSSGISTEGQLWADLYAWVGTTTASMPNRGTASICTLYKAQASVGSYQTLQAQPLRFDVSANTVVYLLTQWGNSSATSLLAGSGSIRALRVG